MSSCPGYDENGRGFACDGTPGTAWTPVWCPSCDKRRLARLAEQFAALAESVSGSRGALR